MSDHVTSAQLLTPMLAVRDAAAAIDFYKAALGAVEVGERNVWEGKIGHVELLVCGARVMLADEFEGHNQSPTQLGGTPVILHLRVDDCDTLTAAAAQAGAEVIWGPNDAPYGRVSKLRDPFGHVWMLNAPSKADG
jgi:PhnB protein